MFQAVLDINLQKSNGEETNWLMVTIPMDDLNEIEEQVNSVVNNLPICEITVVIFDITNKVISHYNEGR